MKKKKEGRKEALPYSSRKIHILTRKAEMNNFFFHA
jgi:hypothetical protein